MKNNTNSKMSKCILDELRAREKKESLRAERMLLLNNLREGKRNFVPAY